MKQKIFAVLTITALLLGSAIVAKTAVSTIAGLAVAQSATVWNSIKDAAVGDALTNGVLASQLYMYNGTTFDRARGDTTFGLDVDVTRLPGGGQTPADGFSNPSTFNGSWSLNGLYNGTTWDRQRSASIAGLIAGALTVGVTPSGLYGYDFTGATTNRYKPLSQINNYSLNIPQVTGQFINITTNADTFIALSGNVGLVLTKLIIATAGTTSNVIVRTEPDGAAPCGGAGSAIVGTFSTLAQGVIDFGGFYSASGLCFTTAGGAAANLMVMYISDAD